MTRKPSFGAGALRYAVLAAVLLGLTALGTLGMRQLSVERAQAQGLIAQGQSDLRQGRRADAVVSFERAQLLAPRAEFVRSALRDANVRDVETRPARMLGWLAPREWSLLLTAFGWVAGLLLAALIGLRKRGRLARCTTLIAGLLCGLSALGVVQSTISARALRVVSSATGLLMAPYQGAGAIADLPVGVVVTAGSRYGQFIHVNGPNGARGWVTEQALESVVAS